LNSDIGLSIYEIFVSMTQGQNLTFLLWSPI
jgi:hypothetical protein